MEKGMFERARDAMANLTNMQGETNETDQEAAKKAIQDAYTAASPEEQEQLKEFEQQLQQKDQLQ